MFLTHCPNRNKRWDTHSWEIKQISEGSNTVNPMHRQLPLPCIRLQCCSEPSPLKSPILSIGNSGVIHAPSLPKSGWQTGLHTKEEMWGEYPESQGTSPMAPGQKFHWVRRGLSLWKNGSHCAMLQWPRVHVCPHSSPFPLINTKKGKSFFQQSFNTTPSQGCLYFSRESLESWKSFRTKNEEIQAQLRENEKKIREQKSLSN